MTHSGVITWGRTDTSSVEMKLRVHFPLEAWKPIKGSFEIVSLHLLVRSMCLKIKQRGLFKSRALCKHTPRRPRQSQISSAQSQSSPETCSSFWRNTPGFRMEPWKTGVLLSWNQGMQQDLTSLTFWSAKAACDYPLDSPREILSVCLSLHPTYRQAALGSLNR